MYHEISKWDISNQSEHIHLKKRHYKTKMKQTKPEKPKSGIFKPKWGRKSKMYIKTRYNDPIWDIVNQNKSMQTKTWQTVMKIMKDIMSYHYIRVIII